MSEPTTEEEAAYLALLYITQRTPRAFAGVAFIRALEQDGFTIVRVAEIASLRRIEEAARAYGGSVYPGNIRDWFALRAALEEKP